MSSCTCEERDPWRNCCEVARLRKEWGKEQRAKDAEIADLQAENARLKVVVDRHGDTIHDYTDGWADMKAKLEKAEADFGITLNEFSSFLQTMTAINEHFGYQFTQPLMAAKDNWKGCKDRYAAISEGGEREG